MSVRLEVCLYFLSCPDVSNLDKCGHADNVDTAPVLGKICSATISPPRARCSEDYEAEDGLVLLLGLFCFQG